MSFPIPHFCTAPLHCMPMASVPSNINATCNVNATRVHSAFPASSSSSTQGFGARPCMGAAGSPLCAPRSACMPVQTFGAGTICAPAAAKQRPDPDPHAAPPRCLAPALLAHEVERLALHLVQEGNKAARARRAGRRGRVRVLQQPAREGLHVVVPAVQC